MTQNDLILGAIMHKRFDTFMRYAFGDIYGRDALIEESYLEVLTCALHLAVVNYGSRQLITMPPRHLKSFCAAVALPARLLGISPRDDICVVTYGGELSREHTGLFRRIISSPWYHRLFPGMRVQQGEDRYGRIATTENGGYRATTTHGALTGMGADVIIIDDIIKAGDVSSQAMREQTLEFITQTVPTRFNDPIRGRQIVCMQRLHMDDVVHYLIEQGIYDHLNLPAIAQRDMTYETFTGEWTFRQGELLSPRRFPQERLDQLRTEMGSAAFCAQFLQEPQTSTTSIIDVTKLVYTEDVLPPERRRASVLSIDTASKIGEGCDYSIICVWAYDGETMHLVDLIRGQFEFPDLKRRTIAAIDAHRPKLVLIEDANAGTQLWQELKECRADGVRAIVVKEPKEARAYAATEPLYAGRIKFPRNVEWFEDLRREIISFPDGRHDDMVDAVSMFANWVRSKDFEFWYRHGVLGERRSANATRRSTGRRSF